MSPTLSEADWKNLSRLKSLALERLCRRILQEAQEMIVRAEIGGSHRAYLDLFRHTQENDKIVSECFDKWSRSNALTLLINWRLENLLTDEEFAAFSAEAREMAGVFLKRVRRE